MKPKPEGKTLMQVLVDDESTPVPPPLPKPEVALTMGEIAYNAYCGKRDRAWTPPPFSSLAIEQRDSWEAAALAVARELAYTSDEPQAPPPEPVRLVSMTGLIRALRGAGLNLRERASAISQRDIARCYDALAAGFIDLAERIEVDG